MKPNLILIIILTLVVQDFVFGQVEAFSKHRFTFYINEKERTIANTEISIITAGDTIKSKQIDSFYIFPIIDTSKKFDLIVKVGSITFKGQDYPA